MLKEAAMSLFAVASLSTNNPTPSKPPVGAMTFKDVGRIWAECLRVSKAEKLHVTGNRKMWLNITLVS